MGCDTNGFLATKEKDIFKICRVIEKSLVDECIRDAGVDGWRDIYKLDKKYSYPSFILHTHGMIEALILFREENRRLSIFTACDSDYSECYKGKKVILSLGAWGESVHLIEVVLKALQSEFGGRAWMRNNDCSDDWRKIK